MIEQFDLFSPQRALAEADAKVLSRFLYLAGDWRTRKQIAEALGWSDHARIRHAANAAGGDVIFGQRGMRHLRHATSEEVAACLSTLSSQRNELDLRILVTQRKYHSFGGKSMEDIS